jgi:hypothetical protein
MARVTFEECATSETGHWIEEDGYVCLRCDGEMCPVCRAWFVDYDAFLVHTETTDGG